MRKAFYHKVGRKDSVFLNSAPRKAGKRPAPGVLWGACRSLRAPLVTAVLTCLLAGAGAGVCLAVPGSGTAQMWPTSFAVAGTYSRWTIRYTATQDFNNAGGEVTVQIPPGWSAPQVSDSTVTGFVRVFLVDPSDLDSTRVSGNTVRVYVGGKASKFRAGEYLEVIYGSSSAYARTQTSAPDTVEFTVASAPEGGAPAPLTSGSPSVRVIPGAVARIAIFLGASEAGAVNLTADDNATLFRARGLDSYGNVTGGIACTWGLTAPLGVLSGGKDSTNTLDARRVGTGYVTAYDDFAHTDSTGLVTVTHGAYARLDVAQPDSAVAGSSFTVSAAALDADGNKITSGAGSSSTLQLSAWLDSLATVPAHGALSTTSLNLAAGEGSTAETYVVSESIFVRAVDVSDPAKSDFGPRSTLVKSAPPLVAELDPDTLHTAAGAQAAFTLTSKDVHGNVSPVSSAQTFYLWKNSANGEFRRHGGSQQIFEVVLPADSSRVFFDYYDTKAGTCQVAAMDVDANSPAFPPATAAVVVAHESADTLLVSGVSDPFTAGSRSDVVVEVRDGFGNRVTDYSGEIEFASSDTNPGTVLPDDYTFAPSDSGRRVFPLSVTLTEAGEQWVRAFDSATPSVDGVQTGITVVGAACDTLVLSVSENPVSADAWLDLEVEALDEYGNRATSYSDVLRFSSSDTGDSTVLPADYQFVPSDNGLHVFDGAVRLTQAGMHSISATDTSQAGTDGTVAGISVLAGTARSVVLFPPGSFQVNAGGTQVLRATVRDAFGNLRAGEPTSIAIKDASDGSLEDDPGNPNNTSGGVAMQTGNTDAAGEITVLYRAPSLAGLSDTLDAYCTTVGHSSVADAFALSTPAGATALRILPVGPLADTAAVALSLRVEAIDSFGNIDAFATSLLRVTTSSPTARISVDGGSSWSVGNSDSLALVAGSTQARLKLTDTKSGNLALLAEDAGGVLISALKNNINLSHALPAGAIAVSADRDTLIADGSSSAAVAAGPVYDAYGNNVGAGELVTVSALLCDVVASDMDTSTAGLQLVTGEGGKASFVTRTGTLAGRDTISVRSLSGTASGSTALTLLEAPYVQVELAPDTLQLTAGGQAAFTLTSRDAHGNTSPVSLTQTFHLWKSSPTGEFRRHGGSQQIFEIELPADSAQVSFDYYDTKAGACQVAAMDVDANSPAFPPATAAVAVTHGPADTLLVSGISDPFTAGSRSDVAVEAMDGFGNRISDFSGQIGFTTSDLNPGVTLPADFSFVQSDSGRHVFPLSVTLTDAGEQWVSAHDLAVPSLDGTRVGITVVAAGCDTLVLRVSDNPVSADSWLDLEVEALDEYGNRATGYSGVVRFSSSDTGDSTVLPADYRFVPADNGLHVFDGAVRLTQVGTQSISTADTLQVGTDGTATGISVLAGTARSVVLFPPGSFQVNAGGTQVLKATARDAFGNPRPGEPTSIVIKDAPDGSLEDDPGNPNNTSGGVTMQTGNTDSAGEITVLYRAPAAAGRTDTVDAYCTTVGHGSVADVGVLSTPAGATALRILPGGPLADTVAATLSVRVEAMDSFGNLDASDASLVRVTASSPTARVSIDGGASWSAGSSDSLALFAGSTQARLKLTDTRAGNLTLLAEDIGGTLISALKANVTLTHALPAGTIAVSSGRDTLIADGNSSATATAGPVYDAYGNNVGAGEFVTVSAPLCDVVASDMDTSSAGLQLATGGDGRVSFVVRAGTAAGADTVTVRSVSGSARGSASLTLLDAPAVAYVSGSLAPASLSPGQTVALSLELVNNGGAGVHLLPASSLSFSDGNDGSFVTALADSVIIPAGGSVVAGFVTTLVPPQLDPGGYSPVLNLSGFDQTGRPYSQTLSPGPNTIRVVSMNVVSILAPLSVSRGAQDVAVQMTLKNDGDVAVEVTSLGLAFSSPGHAYALAGTTLPDTLAGGETRVFDFLVDVDASAPLGECTIDGFASGIAGGAAVSDAHSGSPAVWVVQSDASLAYTAGSLSRTSVSLGQTVAFSVVLENFGTAAVQLDTTGTSLEFGPAGSEYTASLQAPMLLPGGTSTSVAFRPTRVGMDMPLGAHRVQVRLAGLENGAPFADSLWTDPDSVRMTGPGDLRVYSTEAVSPNAPFVDTSQAFSVEVEVENVGDENALNVLVSLASGGGSAITSPVSFGEIPGGARKKLAFDVTASGTPGLDLLTVRIQSATGKLSGLPLSVAGALDDTAAVLIQTPELLSVSASVSEPVGAVDGTVSTDQTLKIMAVAQNLGQGTLASGGMLTLAPPAGFTLFSPAAQALTPGVAVEWSIRAPSSAQSAVPVLVWISSLPQALNTGDAADTSQASQTFGLTVVIKTELSLDASIVAPEDATDGSLRLDTEFRVQAVASNLGTAAAAGTGRLTLTLPSGYSFAAGQAAEQVFAAGSPVTWDVVSPSASSPIQYINAVISQPPLDENANSAASVLVGTRNIAVYAESKHMVAESLPLVEAPDQVAAGDDAIEMMLVRVANPEELGEGSTIGLRALTVYVCGADNARLADPSAAVAGVSVWRYTSGSPAAALGAASAVSANPVRVTFSPEADTLEPGEADTLVVMVDVSPNPRAEGIALELDGQSAFEAFDRSSGELIPVMAPDGTDLLQMLSAPSRLFAGVHNYPNPFRAGYESTTISYYLENDSKVSLKIFTLDGKPVFTQTYSAEDPQGRHGLREIEWDGRNGDGRVVLNGVYICKLEAAGTDATFKIAVAK